MKKKIIAVLSVVLIVSAAVWASARKNTPPQNILNANKVYVFYQKSCPACTEAMEYINGKYLTHPSVVRADLDVVANRELLQQCAKKAGFTNIVIPVICAGDDYTMGWSSKSAEQFDSMLTAVAQ